MIRFDKRCFLAVWLLLMSMAVSRSQAEEVVTIEPQSDALIVKIQNEEFTVFHYGKTAAKPYFWPVRAADGAILTRAIIPGEKDHPHHKGIWLSVDEVNEIKFWAEKGTIALREVTSASGNPATIEVKNEWLGHDGAPIMFEQTKVSIYPDRMFVFDTKLSTPPGRLVRFDDTKEGFLGFRVAQSMREVEGGSVINSEGQKTTKECWGRFAKWVDYTGAVDGKQYGVTVMDDPYNFRRSRFHVRDYGLFSISPFGEGAYQNDPEKAKPVILDNGRPSLKLRYGIFIHDGGPSDVSDAYTRFLKRTAIPGQP